MLTRADMINLMYEYIRVAELAKRVWERHRILIGN